MSTGDMLRAQGFNLPEQEDIDYYSRGTFDYIMEEQIEFYPQSDREVMEAHGIDVDCTPVDTFMRVSVTKRLHIAEAMRAD